MILVIDNYDSFTYNLVHYLEELGAETLVRRNDALSAVRRRWRCSRTPCCSRPVPAPPMRPASAWTLLASAPADLPILGVCLGHQAIGQAFGGRGGASPKLADARQDQPRSA